MGFAAVKPMGFVLKMRLVAPDGTPFSSRFYRVNWCGKTYPPANLPPHQTDTEGSLQELLDASQSPLVQLGELQMLEMRGSLEQVMWSIPLQIVDDPPISVLPGIEGPPMPTIAGTSATEEEISAYILRLAEYLVHVVPALRQRLPEFSRAWGQIKGQVTTLGEMPQLGDSDVWDVAIELAWLRLCDAQLRVTAGFEAAWRLWNLADLPLAKEPSFPLFGADVEMLLRALSRFARRRGAGPVVMMMTILDELEKVKKAHDDRGPLNG